MSTRIQRCRLCLDQRRRLVPPKAFSRSLFRTILHATSEAKNLSG